MQTLLIIILAIVASVLCLMFICTRKHMDSSWMLGGALIFTSCVLFCCMIWLANSGHNKVTQRSDLIDRYYSLLYRIDHVTAESDFNIRYDLYSDIAEYNDKLESNKRWQYNVWVGFAWSDIYDEFPFIDEWGFAQTYLSPSE